jgi:peptidyl-prolyl cis-trans isomerase C
MATHQRKGLQFGPAILAAQSLFLLNAKTQRPQRRKEKAIHACRLCVLCLLCAFALKASDVNSAEPPATGPTVAAKAVVAKVNNEPVYSNELESEFKQAYGDRKFDDEQRQRLMRAALDQVIDRKLLMAHLASTSQAASKADVDAELAQFEKSLKAQNLTLAQHCERVGLSPDDVRRALAWKLSWKRYCEKHLTPQNLEKYFGVHRRDFDGTQLRAAQILFKLPRDADEAAVAAAKERAARLRGEITGGKISFADAAKRYSGAPSAGDGGDVGWIERQRPMPVDFSRAAFALKKGEVSEPLLTTFGVHLISITDEKPGAKTWQDVEPDLRSAVVVYLFRWIADKERAGATIEYVSPP